MPGDTTTYTQGELDDEPIISQYYRVYAVTDRDGKASTANDATRLSGGYERALYFAGGVQHRQRAQPFRRLPSVDTDVTTTPDPRHQPALCSQQGEWRRRRHVEPVLVPSGQLPGRPPQRVPLGLTRAPCGGSRSSGGTPTGGDDNNGAFEGVGAEATATSPAQWTSATDATGTDHTNTLNTAEQLFQVRYVNDPDSTANNDDDVDGVVKRFRVPQTTAANYEAEDLPTIAATDYTADPQTGLRFKHNEVNPTIWLDLVWTADTPGDTDNTHTPTGYVIDYTDAAAIDQHTMWKSLANARRAFRSGLDHAVHAQGRYPRQEVHLPGVP